MSMISLDEGTPVELAEPPPGPFGRVHYSDLCRMDLSEAHFKASTLQRWAPTREMLIGTIVHHLVLGPHRTKPLVRFDGAERKGNVWKEFLANAKKEHGPRCDVVTSKEWEAAEPIAAAVLADPIAKEMLEGSRREVAVQWDNAGIACETDGIDVVGSGFIADLKRTSCTEPGGFARHAWKHMWHCQMAFYEDACRALGIDVSKGLFLIGVEPEPPYAVTTMRLSEAVLEQGRRSTIKWIEKLRRARENDHWPSYTQTIVDFDLPPWMVDEEGVMVEQ